MHFMLCSGRGFRHPEEELGMWARKERCFLDVEADSSGQQTLATDIISVCVCVCVCVCARACTRMCTQLCPTLCHSLDCSPPVSSIQGILQTRILEWVAVSFSRGSSWPRDLSYFSCIAGGFFITAYIKFYFTRVERPCNTLFHFQY